MTLGYVMRALVQVLAVHAIVSTVLAVGAALAWHQAAAWSGSAVVQARRLFFLRLAPGAGGLLAGVLVAIGYALWEKPVTSEAVGLAAIGWAAAGVLLIAAAAWRAAGVLRETRRVHETLTGATAAPLAALPLPASVVDFGFPIVALVGLVHSRLFVARTVLDACTRDELDAIVAHEQAHAVARDNLRRLALSASPDVLALTATGRRIHAAWMSWAELAADERAGSHSGRGLHLASALVKVARLATAPAGTLPATALFRGEAITERVQRLLEPPPAAEPRRWPASLRVLGAALLLAAAAGALPLLHDAAEEVLKLGL